MFWNALLLALRAIRRNLLRSALTTLGVVIGVAAVIAMVNVGTGATVQVQAQIASLGSNLLIIRPGQSVGLGQRSPAKPFELADVKAIEEAVPGIAAIAPSTSRALTAVFGNSNWSTSVVGSDNRYFAARGWVIEQGRAFDDAQVRAGKAVCVIGATVRQELFGSRDPVGEKVRLKNLSCQVIGLLAAKGQSTMGADQDDIVVLPLRAYWRRLAGKQEVGQIQVSVRDEVATEQVRRDIERVLRERRRVDPGEEDNFQVRDLREVAATLAASTRVLTALLGAVAAASLLVGGIGIMNIMLVSVTERTREIGTRLAIGALAREVMLQFLVEAVVLSLFGAVLGVVLAFGLTALLAAALKVPLVLDGSIFVVAFLFAAAIGVVFGYVPARRAARLDPIEALRHE